MARLRDFGRVSRQVRVGAADPGLTPAAGMAATSELCGGCGLIESVNAAVGPIKQRDRGHSLG